ncbi:MAG: protein arginine kinase [Elusimicrobiota bacterium]|nr:protein arginine kinase [Elusimicrobiota bacterium]
MKLNQLAKQKISWVEKNGKSQDDSIVISSRIRLARNVADLPFPNRAGKDLQKEIFNRVICAIEDIPEFKNASVLELNDYDKIDRRLLMERHLISYDLARKFDGEPGVIFTQDEKISIMVNEEDHLRIQIITPGLSVISSWRIISKIDNELDEQIEFAFNKKFGFLTACPTNVGTGLRVSCLMHLCALVATDEIEKLITGLEKVNISTRGFYGEGTKPLGDIFQVSNATTLGKTEEEFVNSFYKIVCKIVNYERDARKKIMQDGIQYNKTLDKIYRAYGILSYSRSIDSNEAISHLTKLRFGSDLKLKLSVDGTELDQLIFIIQPGHLQEILGKEISPEERDIVRAQLIRERLFSDILEGKHQ